MTSVIQVRRELQERSRRGVIRMVTSEAMQKLEKRGIKIEVNRNTLSIVFLEAHCLECGETFIQKRPDQLFGSRRCKNRYNQRIYRKRHR